MTFTPSRFLAMALILSVVAGCGAELNVTTLDYAGVRYHGAVLPLTIEPDDLTLLGVTEATNEPEGRQYEVFSLHGVDSAKIVIVPDPDADRGEYLVYIAETVFPASTPRPNLYELVPSLCVYAPSDTEGCGA